jgi:hypothetical protein
MAWTGTNEQGGKIQKCSICGEKVHMRLTVKHDRENHRKPQFTKRWDLEPIWRCGVLEIRDVKKAGGSWARTGYDDSARYNLWVGHDIYVKEISQRLGDLKKWALEHYDPETGKEI